MKVSKQNLEKSKYININNVYNIEDIKEILSISKK